MLARHREGERDMKFDEVSGWWLPDREQHLQEWMRKVNDRRFGRLLYQGAKYRLAMQFVPVERRKASVAIDVGAHVGLWSFQMIQDFAAVFAFEPMPAHRECWHKNIVPDKTTGAAVLSEAALGDHVGFASLRTRTGDSSGDTGVVPENRLGLPVETTLATRIEPASLPDDVEARMETLDGLFLEDNSAWTDISFVKIDCEGYELFVCRGGIKLFEKHKPTIIVEQKPETGGPERYNVKPTEAVEYLKSHGAKVLAAKQGDYIMGWVG